MRSLLEVKTEIAAIMSTEFKKSTEKSRARGRLKFLKTVQFYLEGNPTEYFIKKEIERLENRNNLLLSQFDESKYSNYSKPKKKYEEEMGIPLLRVQLRALRYIKK